MIVLVCYCVVPCPRGIKVGRVFWLVTVLYFVLGELKLMQYPVTVLYVV